MRLHAVAGAQNCRVSMAGSSNTRWHGAMAREVFKQCFRGLLSDLYAARSWERGGKFGRAGESSQGENQEIKSGKVQ